MKRIDRRKKSGVALKIVLFLLIFILLVVFGLGSYAVWEWNSVPEDKAPHLTVSVLGAPVGICEYNWSAPILGGLLQRPFFGGSGETASLGEFESGALLSFDAGALGGGVLSLEYGGVTQVLTAAQAAEMAVYDAGSYLLSYSVSAPFRDALPAQSPQGYAAAGDGSFLFLASFTVSPPLEPAPEPLQAGNSGPLFLPGRTELEQGDIFAMRVLYLPEGIAPVAETALGEAIFTPVENGWFAGVAIGNIRQPGEYPVSVTAGELSWDVTVTVLPFSFDEQNLIIDESLPEISEANSPKAIEEYNGVMIPMYQTYDEERYWDGVFIQPAQGRISTEFGEIRYTNGDYSNPRPHWGMDIAAAEGTEVVAANNGRVVFSDYLLAVGHTVIIEHGGGLKSYYYHLSARHVETGQTVSTGELIGEVGSTGYSTGPHLHFEMRIGGREQVISPSMLFDASAGLYSTESAPGQE